MAPESITAHAECYKPLSNLTGQGTICYRIVHHSSDFKKVRLNRSHDLCFEHVVAAGQVGATVIRIPSTDPQNTLDIYRRQTAVLTDDGGT